MTRFLLLTAAFVLIFGPAVAGDTYEWDDRTRATLQASNVVGAQADAATLRAEVERLRGALQAFKDFDDLPTIAKRPDVFELRVRQPILAALEGKA